MRDGQLIFAFFVAAEEIERVIGVGRGRIQLDVLAQQVVGIGGICPITLIGDPPVAPGCPRVLGEGGGARAVEGQISVQVVVYTRLIGGKNQGIQTPFRGRVLLFKVIQVFFDVRIAVEFAGAADEVTEALGVGLAFIELQGFQVIHRGLRVAA